MINLESLDLSLNQISQVPIALKFKLPTSTYPKLKTLNLNNNRLKSSFPPYRIFKESLTQLYVSGNAIEDINVDALKGIEGLETLDLRNNSINNIPNELGLLGKLKCLSLTGNLFRVPRRAILDRDTAFVLEYLRNRIAWKALK